MPDSYSTPPKILITGGAGFIGGAVIIIGVILIVFTKPKKN